MTTITTEFFRNNLREVLRQVREGRSFSLVAGEDNEVIARLLPANSTEDATTPRPIGLLSGVGSFTLNEPFKMNENEFTAQE
ncbi:MAG: hypothetical protein U0U46_19950 [Saprospiraceae bacterium]